MPLIPGSRLGPYEVIAPIGEGGMGQVYRAHDARLGRDVAIKIIPEALARDPDRVARFEREARAVAALSHPNILAIFDTGTTDGTLFVVMELLAGETLRERLGRGPLPLRKAVEIAALMATGLAAAHDKGLVHRDVKPENVFLTADGQVKILDFGLARPEPAPTTAGETRAAITDAGTVLGTVGYMAPEQVRAYPVDARADLFALGAVLYEMLTGQRPFDRPTTAETMTAILNEDPPDLVASRGSPALDRIVRHCLEKEPADRFQTARDVAFALNAFSGSGTGSAVSTHEHRPARITRERLAWAFATLSLAGVAAWLALASPVAAPDPPQAWRAVLLFPEGIKLSTEAPARRFAVSPDGRKVALIAERGDERQLWIQSLAAPSPNLIAGSEGANGPLWATDSRTLSFTQNRDLKLLDTEGGRPVGARVEGGVAAWGPSGDRIVVSTTRGEMTLVSADGTEQQLVVVDVARGQRLAAPSFLPGGRAILYSFVDLTGAQLPGYYVATRTGAPPTMLAPMAVETDRVNAIFASGHLLSVRDGMIVARPMTLDPPALGSAVHTIAGPVDTEPGGGAAFSASETGVLIYQAPATNDYSRLFWFNRSGARLSRVGDDAWFTNLELSPDGGKLLVGIPDPATRQRDIWVIDLARGVRTRLTFDDADERSAVWSPDSASIVYRGRGGQLHRRPVGPGEESPFVADGVGKDPLDWSRDGQFVVYRASGAGSSNDLMIKRVGSADPPIPFLATPFSENYGKFSPDGRLLAYVSNESGENEVYITRFPSGGLKERVSTDGGSFPQWRRDGRELFYLRPDGRLMAAGVNATDSTIQIETAKELFDTGVVEDPGSPFVVSDDGRFLINTAVPSSAPPSLHVVFNWPSLIKAGAEGPTITGGR